VMDSSGWPHPEPRRPLTSTNATSGPRRATRSISLRRKRRLRARIVQPASRRWRSAAASQRRPKWCASSATRRFEVRPCPVWTMSRAAGRFHGWVGVAPRLVDAR
jgi:hypothetical protein